MAHSASAQCVTEAARRLGLPVQLREFPQGTRTAADAAAAIGAQVGQIVKSLVFLADGSPVLCLLSGANRLDTQRLAEVTGAASIQRADADAVRAATGFAIGGVPPFGHRTPLPVYCDRDLLSCDTVWAAAGTPTTVFAADPRALVEACGAVVADLKEER